MTSHLSDHELQEWAEHPDPGMQEISDHIRACPACALTAEAYRSLFTSVALESRPAFDFDLTALIIPRLSEYKPGKADRFIAGFLIVFVVGFIGIPLYLFRQNIRNIFYGIPTFFLYAIIGSAVSILAVYAAEVYLKFRRQLQMINF